MNHSSQSSQTAEVLKKQLMFQKIGIFVDAENIEMSGLKHHEGRTDYKKILSEVGEREIIRILYYKPEYKEISQTFSNFWWSLGGEIRRPQKNADPFLIVDAVTMADKMDVAIIIGGDRDYLPLIWYLRSRGCKVEIWSWPETTSDEVMQAADIYFPLSKDKHMILSKSSSSSDSSKSKSKSSSKKSYKKKKRKKSSSSSSSDKKN